MEAGRYDTVRGGRREVQRRISMVQVNEVDLVALLRWKGLQAVDRVRDERMRESTHISPWDFAIGKKGSV